MKKKIIPAIALALVCFVMPFGASADELASETSQEISVTLTAEPSYTVTIPASVNMGNEGTAVDVTADAVENLPENKKVSVTIAGTSGYKNQMVLEGQTESGPRTSIRYQITNEAGEVIETIGTSNSPVGKEIVSFTENGTKQYSINPVIAGNFKYDVAYTGSITFGIALADR